MKAYDMKNRYLLVKPMDSERRMANNIVIKDQAGKKSVVTGVVKSADKKLGITDGTVVLYPAYAVDDIMTEEFGPCVILKFDDVVAVEAAA